MWLYNNKKYDMKEIKGTRQQWAEMNHFAQHIYQTFNPDRQNK